MRTVISLVLTLFFTSGCGSASSPASIAPNELHLVSATTTGLEGEIVPLYPEVSGSLPMKFSVSPDLPEGIAIDPVSGRISGKPVADLDATVPYTLKVENDAGGVAASFYLLLEPPRPSHLTYADPSPNYVVGKQIAINSPANEGGLIAAYYVDRPLPEGLHLDGMTGNLYGTPTKASPATSYRITGITGLYPSQVNPSWLVETTITITVTE